MSLDITPYLDVNEAWDYFNTRLDMRDWQIANDDQKLRSLKEATRLINNLKFRGHRFDPLQDNAFPRVIFKGDVNFVPNDVKIATCEIAISLLDSTDMEQEIENLFVKGQSYATVTTGYNGTPDYMRAGIPSAIAWNYLRPYLCNPKHITLSRVD